jgi:hypothetical protein
MMNSKQIKNGKYSFTDPDDLNLWGKVKYHTKEWFYRLVTYNYHRYKERISRSYDYAKFGWDNYDFDMGYVYDVLEFKLKRLQRSLTNGYSVQDPKDMEALTSIIKAVERLRKGEYDDKYLDQHDKVWGKIESKTTPNYDENGKIKNYSWDSWRSGTKDASKKVKEKERKEYLKCYDLGEKDRCEDIDLLAFLLKKHAPFFWD